MQLPDESVQAADAANEPVAGAEVKLTAPVGVPLLPVTVAVHVVAAPRVSDAGLQLTAVLVALGGPPEPEPDPVTVIAVEVPSLTLCVALPL